MGWVACGSLGLESSHGLVECLHGGGINLGFRDQCVLVRESCVDDRFDNDVDIDGHFRLWRWGGRRMGRQSCCCGSKESGTGEDER